MSYNIRPSRRAKQIFLSRIPHLAFLTVFGIVIVANSAWEFGIPLSVFAIVLAIVAAYVIYKMCMPFPSSYYTTSVCTEGSPLDNFNSDLCKVIYALENQILLERNRAEYDRKVNEWWVKAFFIIAFFIPFTTWCIAVSIYENSDSYSNLWALIFSGTSVGWISFSAAKALSIRQGSLRKEVNYHTNKLSNLRKIGLMASQEERLGSPQVLDLICAYFSLQEYFQEHTPEDKENESSLATIVTNMAKMMNR